MKIGILTQPLQSNYGGLLQNYALQQTLVKAGHEVKTIDWNAGNNLREVLYRIKVKMMHALSPSKYPASGYWPTVKERSVIQRNTNRFVQSYIKHTEVIHSYKGFVKQSTNGAYDAFVVGSDQCWRPAYNAFLPSMFLDFAQKKQVKRIAYAASFGTDKWEFTPQQTNICAALAKMFDLVTVREDSGVKLCKEFLGVDAMHVLDPTMLLTKDDYIQLIEAEKEPHSAGTLFNYILDPNAKKTAFIQRVAKVQKQTSFQVLPKCQAETRTMEDVKNRIEDCVFPSVTAWLRAFMDAEMTIVDSFHGMVFSIIFNKPFWVIGNEERGMSRFTSLLKQFQLEDRLLDVNHLDDIDCSKPIDWARVNRILEDNQMKSKALLLDQLKA